MLHGPLAGKIVRFALPLAAASILQQLFNSADLAVIGQFEDSVAMAAVGSNAALVNLLVSLFGGLSLGSNVLIATLIGKEHREAINDAVHTSITLALISGCLVCGIGEILAPVLLQMMDTPADVLELASLYLRIFFMAMPFMLIYDFGSSVLRARGDSTRPLIILIISGSINVVLNIFFVAGCGLSVAGVAIATVISNIFSAAALLHLLRAEKGEFHFAFRRMRLHRIHASRIIAIGAPAGLQGMVFSLSNVVIQAGINSFGAACIAGNTAGQNFEFMCYFIVNAFAQAATTFTSQNFAAGSKKRCSSIFHITMLIGLSATFALSMFFYAGRSVFIRIFTDDPEVIRYAFIRMMFVANLEIMTGIYEMPGGCMRGMGHSLTPAIITMTGSCIFRLIWVYTIFASHHTLPVLMMVYPASWVICGTAMNIAYQIIKRREFSKLSERGSLQ